MRKSSWKTQDEKGNKSPRTRCVVTVCFSGVTGEGSCLGITVTKGSSFFGTVVGRTSAFGITEVDGSGTGSSSSSPQTNDTFFFTAGSAYS